MHVSVCSVGMSGWLVISREAYSLFQASGAFKGMKTGTLINLEVKSYLSALTTGNIKYDWGISLSDSWARWWSLAGALARCY